MNNRFLLVIIFIVAILIAIPLTLYLVKQQTNNNIHASTTTFVQPTQQQKTQTLTQQSQPATSTNILSQNGWDQDNVTRNNDGSISVTTPTGINWYYVSNTNTPFNLNSKFSLDIIMDAHSTTNPSNQKIGYIHLMNKPTSTDASALPDELIIGIDNTNNLILYTLHFTSDTKKLPTTYLVNSSDAIAVPSSHHLIIQVAGIDTTTEHVSVLNGDSNTVLASKDLPLAIFATHSLYVKSSIENEPSESGGATLDIKRMQITNT